MPCVIACAMTSHVQHAMHVCRQASHPYDYMACQKLLIDLPFMPAEKYLSKLTASHFNTLNMQIANQNMLEMLLIARRNGNKADCNFIYYLFQEKSKNPIIIKIQQVHQEIHTKQF